MRAKDSRRTSTSGRRRLPGSNKPTATEQASAASTRSTFIDARRTAGEPARASSAPRVGSRQRSPPCARRSASDPCCATPRAPARARAAQHGLRGRGAWSSRTRKWDGSIRCSGGAKRAGPRRERGDGRARGWARGTGDSGRVRRSKPAWYVMHRERHGQQPLDRAAGLRCATGRAATCPSALPDRQGCRPDGALARRGADGYGVCRGGRRAGRP